MNGADFWNDNDHANAVVKEVRDLKDKIEDYDAASGAAEEVAILLEIYDDDPSEENEAELQEGWDSFKKTFETFRLSTMLSGEYDGNNAILSIHPGAGGTESQDWADMLLRMYTRYGERNRYRVTMLDYLEGDVAGIKSVTLLFEGKHAYGYLKAEKGVHRLVRISPFNAAGKRQTSFASVDVLPEIHEASTIEIDPKDLRVDTYRSSGAGGQHINKTDSAVRITHLPTGIVVACQNERSQIQNRAKAMEILTSKLMELMHREHKEKLSDLQGDFGQIAWGNQIRSYVFHPYTLVKDHRTGYETGNIKAVMDGEITGFIFEYLKQNIGEEN